MTVSSTVEFFQSTHYGINGKTQLIYFFFCFFQIELDKIVTHRNSIYERLSQPVITLDELNSAFQLLQELGDMENTIDDVYLPVENIYAKLR